MPKELYRDSRKDAVEWGELELWRESYKENCACARAIEKAIADNFDGMHLNADVAKGVIKCFFSNIKRGGILLVQVAVGSLYMFSLPRGYSDGFNGWCKQIIGLCFTTFMQTTLLFLGLITMQAHPLLGLGVMLASNEVPRIAQQFGLETGTRVNMMSAVHTTTTAINLGRAVFKK